LKSWVDELKQKRRKVKPSQLHSSQPLIGSSTLGPLESQSVPSLSQPYQMSFTRMLMVCTLILEYDNTLQQNILLKLLTLILFYYFRMFQDGLFRDGCNK